MKISIPTPCSENWSTMQPREQGRFCASCQKCVIDFTTASDTAIIDFLSTKKEGVCGHFTKSQLDRTLIINKISNRHRFGMVASMLFVSAVSFSKNTIEMSKPLFVLSPFQNQKVDSIDEKSSINISSKLEGHILDTIDNQAIVGAIIKIKGDTNTVNTDIDGYFKMTIPNKFNNAETIIEISALGYHTKEIKLLSLLITEDIKIALSYSEMMLGEVVITKVKRPIWRRVVYFFKRLF
jgi:hypothetical protein